MPQSLLAVAIPIVWLSSGHILSIIIRIRCELSSARPQLREVLRRIVAFRKTSLNPFNPSTDILFTVGHSGEASLELYEIGDRAVKTLFQGHVSSGQQYRVRVSGSGPSRGTYVCRL
jgi:hypothetical protein